MPAIGATRLSLDYPLGGAFVVEAIFNWPGSGQLFVGAALTRDYPVAQGFVACTALVVLLDSLATNITLRIADPRLHFESTSGKNMAAIE